MREQDVSKSYSDFMLAEQIVHGNDLALVNRVAVTGGGLAIAIESRPELKASTAAFAADFAIRAHLAFAQLFSLPAGSLFPLPAIDKLNALNASLATLSNRPGGSQDDSGQYGSQRPGKEPASARTSMRRIAGNSADS
jgi:hypothetical protein